MKILLAVDTSAASDAAVSELAERPLLPGSSVEVLSVVDQPPSWTIAEVAEELSRLTDERVLRVAEILRAKGLDVSTLVLSGDPKAKIVDRAKEIGADLVVVGSHSRGDVAAFLLGSVAKAVVRFAPCSVRIVRAKPGESQGGAMPESKVMPEGGAMKVLLATDGSDGALLAAQAVAARAWPPGTEVRILSVVELGLTNMQAFLEPPFVDSEAMKLAREDAMKHAQGAIRAAEEVIAGVGLKVSEDVSVLVERPQQIIIDEAKSWDADLIVLGSHGRQGLSRFLLGSVSEAVATHASCSVELVRKTH